MAVFLCVSVGGGQVRGRKGTRQMKTCRTGGVMRGRWNERGCGGADDVVAGKVKWKARKGRSRAARSMGEEEKMMVKDEEQSEEKRRC
jgi:hypothetical protein